MECFGNESSLLNCTHAGILTHNCGHSEDAGVICLGENEGWEAGREVGWEAGREVGWKAGQEVGGEVGGGAGGRAEGGVGGGEGDGEEGGLMEREGR